MECLNCKIEVKQTKGKRSKLYCSENCRVEFFRKKKTADGPKRGRGRPKGGFKGIVPTIQENIAAGNPPVPYESQKPENKIAISKVLTGIAKDNRKILNPDADKTKQMKEPAEGTSAFFLRYGAFTKAEIKEK